MKLVWVSAATHRSGAAVLVIVGAHFRKHLASLEDILLYTVLVSCPQTWSFWSIRENTSTWRGR